MQGSAIEVRASLGFRDECWKKVENFGKELQQILPGSFSHYLSYMGKTSIKDNCDWGLEFALVVVRANECLKKIWSASNPIISESWR